jgi:hypothetical protein
MHKARATLLQTRWENFLFAHRPGTLYQQSRLRNPEGLPVASEASSNNEQM